MTLKKSPIFWIFLTGLTLRLFFVLGYPQFEVTHDAWHYSTLAKNLVTTLSYQKNGQPDIFWAPGYPLFLALIYSVTDMSDTAVRVVQAVLSSVLILMVFQLARRFFGQKIATVAALLVCIHPGFIGYTGKLLPQVWISFILLSLIYFLVFRRLTYINGLLVGMVCGYATLVRSEFLMLSGLMFAVYLFTHLREFKKCLMVLVGVVMVLSVWTTRNYQHYGRPIVTTVHFSDSLWLATYKEEWLEWYPDREPYKSFLKIEDPLEQSDAFMAAAIENLKTGPLIYLKMCFKRAYRLWLSGHSNIYMGLGGSTAGYLKEGNYLKFALKLLFLAFNMSLVAIGFYGLFKSRKFLKERGGGHFYIVFPIGFYMVLHFFFFATPRYSIPPLLLLLMFFSFSIVTLWERRHGVQTSEEALMSSDSAVPSAT